jgi:hypothetical protein
MVEDDRWAGYSRAELTAKAATARRSTRGLTLILAMIAVAIAAFNAGRGTTFLMRLGAPPETAWIGSFIADAGMVAALLGTWYMHGNGGRSGWLTATVWGTAGMSWVLTVGNSVFPAYGSPNLVGTAVFSGFPALLVLVAHSAAAVQRHASVRIEELDDAIRRAPRKQPSTPAATPAQEPVRTPAPVPVRAEKPARTEIPAQRPTRAEVVAELAAEIRRTNDWAPNYPELMKSTGYGRSWCEKTVSEARAAVDTPAPLRAVEAVR